jgi:hypothetical protein
VDRLPSLVDAVSGRAHFMRNLFTRLPNAAQGFVATMVSSIFAQPDTDSVSRRMVEAGRVRRVRPDDDRGSILDLLAGEGRETIERACGHHRQAIDQHFSRDLATTDIKSGTRALEKVSAHARPVRQGASAPSRGRLFLTL